jgi:hypothetical protein
MGIQVIKAGSSAYLKLAGDVALTSSLVSVVDQAENVSGLQLATASIGLTMPTFLALPNWTNTLGTKDGFSSQQTVAVASLGTGVFRLIRNAYTINNTAAQTGSVTGYFLNATETALNGITHNLLDLQLGGVSQFKVSRIGVLTMGALNCSDITISTTSAFLWNSRSVVRSPSDGVITLLNNSENGFNRLQLGGGTSSFPAIKRNGAAIDFRLADDSGPCTINSLSVIYTGNLINNNFGYNRLQDAAVVGLSSDLTKDASAILQANSTTKGFLMPRMTTAQINAIAAPANGLMVYNTTQLEPCFYDGTGWKRLLHLAM